MTPGTMPVGHDGLPDVGCYNTDDCGKGVGQVESPLNNDKTPNDKRCRAAARQAG